MHCNICLLAEFVKVVTCKSFFKLNNTPLIFAYEFYHLKIYNFISVSQTQIGENADNVVESYSLEGNYYHVSED